MVFAKILTWCQGLNINTILYYSHLLYSICFLCVVLSKFHLYASDGTWFKVCKHPDSDQLCLCFSFQPEKWVVLSCWISAVMTRVGDKEAVLSQVVSSYCLGSLLLNPFFTLHHPYLSSRNVYFIPGKRLNFILIHWCCTQNKLWYFYEIIQCR